uniref:Uncharacterized protein n=1 Tax=Euplotes harpa TaxID=151035 RepID=A0A7S3J2R2_9SPIT
MLVAFVLAWLLPCAFCASESMGAAPGTVLHAEGKNTQLVTALVFVGMFLLVLLYAFIDCWCSRSKSKKRANDEGNSEGKLIEMTPQRLGNQTMTKTSKRRRTSPKDSVGGLSPPKSPVPSTAKRARTK